MLAFVEHRYPSLWPWIQLMRLDRPIGSMLLMWPTLWALWIAADGTPSLKNIVIFVLGVFVMRAAGCVINDFADRNFDGSVERTRGRPLATGALSAKQALGLFVGLLFIALILVLFLNRFTFWLAFGGLGLAILYPFTKRFTNLPQVVLGAAFSWAIPMAFGAETASVPPIAWLLFIINLLWTVAYDTEYAMCDREDDLKIGIKSTAILFGDLDKVIIGILQGLVLAGLVLVGLRLGFGLPWYLGLLGALVLFVHQQWRIRYRERWPCFHAFLNNHWVGACVFVGLFLQYL
ncbi:4-hydroxybenzoate octaprenyltransferase [Alloalcanivorax xenomutans]|jgi:4-hydroxybenzoate polyprenyltransferase|uniref:4-hydroxybenzoate octaprenyltransferase n=1 Tax=Alloalcanivorax xenomutans TaxID=1094342 RepID=A0A9Q3W366_9GAMM|nr:4-hydroxybenzoate octaprenyltransferase [Alloalcanivorax xenomutans]ERS09358.1 4-hydroxybenzoate polyprenyltransferase [Alcanivorax sp. PN-3]KYZ85659.1 4-hydroxybenzoate octaprenyltransferase [Alcanivorax sp. KX64203]PHS72263.1 MAG: 4-hydroxybenzoate octaprenyltransferase [Alcanivorax sp.]ARB47613.1 4-hydroxybenzoate polyprenyltransferase [Alloalcanivorax xenomutans]MCE7507517.1 4-hydroxybenzoate octaprenyltransferase [Alloalcanivorax xenomutans]